MAETERGAGVVVGPFDKFSGFEEPVIEDASLDQANSTETPRGRDELFDERPLGGSLRIELGEGGLEQLFERGFVFDIDDGLGGGEAVSESVETNGFASFGCAGAGAVLGVAAIGVDLFLEDMEGIAI